MNYFCIENDGEADVNKIRLFGFSSKRKDIGTDLEKIGKFGTGLKYSLACLARINALPTFTIGDHTIIKCSLENDEIIFNVENIKTKEKTRIPTSIHKGLGEFDWSDTWFALRDLISNAYDEGGILFGDKQEVEPLPDRTCVYIPNVLSVQTAKLKIPTGFLFGQACIAQYPTCSLYHGSGLIYKQGVLIADVGADPSQRFQTAFNYNFKSIRITESRTCDVWTIKSAIRDTILHMKAEHLSKILKCHLDKNSLEMQIAMWGSHQDKKAVQDAFVMAFGADAVIAFPDKDHYAELIRMGRNPIVFENREWEKFLLAHSCPSGLFAGVNDGKYSLTEVKPSDLVNRVMKKWFPHEGPLPKIFLFNDIGDGVRGYTNRQGICINRDIWGDTTDCSMILIENITKYLYDVKETNRVVVDMFLRKMSYEVPVT